MVTVHLVHGFNVHDKGRGTIAALAPYFESDEWAPSVFSYGWIGLMGVWYLNPRIVKQLVQRVRPGDVGIAHSNGCVLLLMAARYGAPFKAFIYINPALSSNAPPTPPYVKVLVLHNEDDHPVKFAAWLRALAPWAPLGDSLWGDMGARGYQPGKYEDTASKPDGLLNRAIHAVNLTCARFPIALLLSRVLIGVPIALLYWFVVAPFEVALTFFINNVVHDNKEMALSMRRIEDRTFVFVGLVIPLLFWAAATLFLK